MTGKKQCNQDANCHEDRENVEQSSDSKHALEDKRKEELYSDGGGRKTDFGGEEEPPHATENESKK